MFILPLMPGQGIYFLLTQKIFFVVFASSQGRLLDQKVNKKSRQNDPSAALSHSFSEAKPGVLSGLRSVALGRKWSNTYYV